MTHAYWTAGRTFAEQEAEAGERARRVIAAETPAATVTVYTLHIDGDLVFADENRDYRDAELAWWLQHDDFGFYRLGTREELA
jgi:hypothetical protein